MFPRFQEVERPVDARALVDVMDPRCGMAITFHWGSFGGQRPPKQEKSLPGAHRSIGRRPLKKNQLYALFAATIGIASTLQRFNSSRAKHFRFPKIPIGWGCDWKVRS